MIRRKIFGVATEEGAGDSLLTFPEADVQAYEAGTSTPIDMYVAESGGSPTTIQTDTQGVYEFWVEVTAAARKIKLEVSKLGHDTQTIDDIFIIDTRMCGSNITNVLYVDKNRIDSYEDDGSSQRPFKTIQAAIDAVVSPSATNKYLIEIAPGAYYTEALSVNKVYLTFRSCGIQGARISGKITITNPDDPTPEQITFVGLRISGGLECLASHTCINVIDCNITGTAWVFNPTVPTDDEYLQVFGGLYNVTTTLTNVYTYLMGGGYYCTFVATNKEFNINNADINDPFQVTLSGTIIASAYGDRAGNSKFILTAGATLNIDADTEGGSVLTVDPAATVNRTTKASNVKNDSSVSGVNVKIALETLKTAVCCESLYDAVIAPSGGDYSSILTACATEAEGTTFFIRNGTYIETSNIVLKSKQKLIGESRDGVIIDLGGADRQMIIAGDTQYTTGTVGVTNNSKTVTGSGTLWLANLSAGDYIIIDGIAYKIASITNDTTLLLDKYYDGKTRSGIYYYACTFAEEIELRNFTITGANPSGSFKGAISLSMVVRAVVDNVCVRNGNRSFCRGVEANYCPNSKFNDLLVYDNGTGIFLESCDGSTVSKCTTYMHYYSAGIYISDGNNIRISNCISNGNNRGIYYANNLGRRFVIEGNTCIGNTEDGIVVASINDSGGAINGNVCAYNGNYGIYINNADNLQVSGNNVYGNYKHGIFVTGGAYGTCIVGNDIIDNDYSNTFTYDGIYIDSGVLYTVIVGNRLNNNDRYQINNAGTGTVIEGNNTYSNDKVGEVYNTGTMFGKNYNFTNAVYEYFGVDGSGYVLTTNVSSPVTCVASACYDNIGAGGVVTYNLPVAVRGARIKFIRLATYDMILDAAAGDYIKIGASSSTSGGTCTLTADYTDIELECFDDANWVAQGTPVGSYSLA